MSDWIIPLVFGGVFYVLGTLRSRVTSLGKPPNQLSRALRSYGTIWAVGEGYLILGIRSMLDGTALYRDIGAIVMVASLLWVAAVTAVGVMRNRSGRAAEATRPDRASRSFLSMGA
jgi:hypothetical protein